MRSEFVGKDFGVQETLVWTAERVRWGRVREGLVGW
jgi:hypothetical protein